MGLIVVEREGGQERQQSAWRVKSESDDDGLFLGGEEEEKEKTKEIRGHSVQTHVDGIVHLSSSF